MLNFFTIYWNLIFVLVITSMSVEHKCYHTVNDNSHIKRFCSLVQLIWLQSAKVIRGQQFESSALCWKSKPECALLHRTYSGFDFLIIHHTVNDNSHMKRFCSLVQFFKNWLQSAKVIRDQQFESSALCWKSKPEYVLCCTAHAQVLIFWSFIVRYVLLSLEKRADISRRQHWFSREMTSQERAQTFHTDDMSLPRSR